MHEFELNKNRLRILKEFPKLKVSKCFKNQGFKMAQMRFNINMKVMHEFVLNNNRSKFFKEFTKLKVSKCFRIRASKGLKSN